MDVGRPAVPVGIDEKQVPDGVEGVDLQLVVIVGVAVGIDEDLEIILLVDDRVVGGERRPDVRFLQVSPDIKIPVVP